MCRAYLSTPFTILHTVYLGLTTMSDNADSTRGHDSNSDVKVKVNYADIAVHSIHLTAMGNGIPYGITQCYLPLGSRDFSVFTPARW